MTDLLRLSATTLAGMVRRREVSPVELTQAHLDRIDAVNPRLNAVAVYRHEQALTEAAAAERAVMHPPAGGLPPLHGVPCTVKEFLGVRGLPNTGGITAFRGRRAREDATIVARVRAAGAIVLGLTNVPEGGLWLESDNRIYGRTNNPWDLTRTPGGSSGGEGAIVAAGGAPFGLGADIGGSIRIPAGFCGVVGHKPSGRLVPTTGHFPAGGPALQHLLCLGPLARRVDDLMPLLRLMAGPDGRCAAARPMPLGDPEQVRIEDLTVYIAESRSPYLRRAMRDGVDRAAAVLEARGARVRPLRLDAIGRAVEIWAATLAEGSGDSYAHLLGGHRPIYPLLELARLAAGRSEHTASALVMASAELLTGFAASTTARLAEEGRRLARELPETLGPNGVLLYPPYTRPAPRHHGALVTAFDGRCTPLFNVLELPVTVLPVGFHRGLPVSVQIAARPGADHLTIAAARAVEDALGGWVMAEPPPA